MPSLTNLIFPSSVDLSSGAKQMLWTARATTDTYSVIVYFDHYNAISQGVYFFTSVDSFLDGQSQSTITVPISTTPGTYIIDHVNVYDQPGNLTQYTTAQLQQMGIATSFTVGGSDTTGPTLTALNFPTHVSLAGGSKQITFSASGTDPHGISEVIVRFDNHLLGTGFIGIFGTASNTWDDGSSAATATIDAATPNGVYTITSIDIRDDTPSANQTTYTTAQLAALGFNTQITISDQDTVAPQLRTLIFPTNIDVSAGAKSVRFAATATDDDSGIAFLRVHFDKDMFSGGPGPTLLDIADTTSDPWSDGAAAANRTVAEAVPTGDYHITSVDVTDNAGNEATYTAAQLQAKGIATTIHITGGKTPDTRGPVLDRISIPEAVNPKADNGRIQIGLGATDQTGIKDGTIYLDHNILLSGGLASGFLLNGAFDSWSDGFSSGAWFIAPGAAPGLYEIDRIVLRDTLGYSSTYLHSQLGSHSAFFVLSPSFNVLPGNVIGGTPGNDNLTGTSANNVLYGLEGNDILTCGGGHDYLYGGKGNDTYRIISASDELFEFAGEGTDRALTGINFTLKLGLSIELLATLNASLTISINLTGNEISNTIQGNAGKNIINGGKGIDYLYGYGGNDIYYVDNVGDKVYETAGYGSDRVYTSVSYTLTSTQSIELLLTNNAASRAALNFYGNGFAQTIQGNAGNNIINGYGGADLLYGLSGNDTYYVDNLSDRTYETNGQGSDRVYTSISYTLTAGQSIELFLTDSFTSTLAIGLYGNDFAQTIYGNAGNNVINGKGGADIMYGLGGNDTYYVDNASDRVFESAGAGSDRVYTSVSYALRTGQSIELFLTTNAANTAALHLTGNDLSQTIYGNAGNNIINGKGGVDAFYGLGGNDQYYVDSATDSVFEAVGAGTDRVFTSVSYTLRAGQSIELFTTINPASTVAINLTGNNLAQSIYGNAGSNTIDGGGGGDSCYGGSGNDTYIVHSQSDIVSEAVNGGSDTVKVAYTGYYVLQAGSEIETFTTTDSSGTAAISLIANEFDNTVIGNEGDNQLDGAAGNDTLLGGGGHDTFVFNTALSSSTNVDFIQDFNPANDTFQLEDQIFTALVGPVAPISLSQLTPGAFFAGPAAHDADDRIIYDTSPATTSNLYYDADGNNAGSAPILFATLAGHPTLTFANFFVS